MKIELKPQFKRELARALDPRLTYSGVFNAVDDKLLSGARFHFGYHFRNWLGEFLAKEL